MSSDLFGFLGTVIAKEPTALRYQSLPKSRWDGSAAATKSIANKQLQAVSVANAGSIPG